MATNCFYKEAERRGSSFCSSGRQFSSLKVGLEQDGLVLKRKTRDERNVIPAEWPKEGKTWIQHGLPQKESAGFRRQNKRSHLPQFAEVPEHDAFIGWKKKRAVTSEHKAYGIELKRSIGCQIRVKQHQRAHLEETQIYLCETQEADVRTSSTFDLRDLHVKHGIKS
jgi:hypothetical protein